MTLCHLEKRHNVIWKRDTVSFGKETLCHLEKRHSVIWKRDTVSFAKQTQCLLPLLSADVETRQTNASLAAGETTWPTARQMFENLTIFISMRVL